MNFEPFPKIPRRKKGVVVTEKLDGTNAQVLLVPYADVPCSTEGVLGVTRDRHGELLCAFAGSRKRFITPGKSTDNFGFAAWVAENLHELGKLGEGRHFGEWYGRGIQRGYGLEERRFALFNAGRWKDPEARPECCEVVPVLYQGEDLTAPDWCMDKLHEHGSQAVKGFADPEGIIVYHAGSGQLYKQTFEMDGGKWQGEAA